jgi:signal transduction histidine kinase
MRISILKEHIPQERMVIFEESKDFIVTALEEIRNLSHRLAPSFFNDKTLEEAFIKLFNSFNFLKEYSIKMNFCDSVLKENLSLDLKLNLYRILQEQLKNIMKYAKASEIVVEVTLCKNHILKMRIADNGIGFNMKEVKHGIGISNMKRRAELSAGELCLQTSPGNGTEIIIIVPLEG